MTVKFPIKMTAKQVATAALKAHEDGTLQATWAEKTGAQVNCQYFDGEGHVCAVGAVLTPEEQHALLGNMDFDQEQTSEALTSNGLFKAPQAVWRLQMLHDRWAKVISFHKEEAREKFLKLARKYAN